MYLKLFLAETKEFYTFAAKNNENGQ